MITPSIIFMGSSDFSLPSLRKLAENKYSILAIITQPDRLKGRGRNLASTPVKILSEQLGIPIFQPENINAGTFREMITKLNPDLCVTASYGQILSSRFLKIPRFGIVNVHASLLPTLRGAAPVQWAIINGLSETGVTIMVTERGLDSGPILTQIRCNIESDSTSGQLESILAEFGANLLIKTIPGYLNGSILPVKQNDALATYAPKLKLNEGNIDWRKSSIEIDRLIRGLNPAPGAFTWFRGLRIKILSAMVSEDTADGLEPGMILGIGPSHSVCVGTGSGVLKILTAQPESKRKISGDCLILGRYLTAGSCFDKPEVFL